MSGLYGVRAKLVVHGLAIALSLATTSVAFAQGRAEPTPEQVQAAAEAFDSGRDAYKAGRYGEAAEQFERADSSAPSATALELAIKARDKAGDLDRAATLALLAVELYSSEVQNAESGLGKIAPPLLERARQELYELQVQCNEACQLVDGKKLVHGEPVAERSIFLSPGQHELVAGFSEGRTQKKSVTATAAASGEIAFEAPPVTAEPSEPEAAQPPPEPEGPVDEGPKESGGWSPTVFFVGAGLTVAAAGVTVWSGIDTKNNPGPERVKNECMAGDEECELYKTGQQKELRTNILIGVTGGLAVATALVGAFAVDWGGGSKSDSSAQKRKIQPLAGWSHGPKLGVRGTF